MIVSSSSSLNHIDMFLDWQAVTATSAAETTNTSSGRLNLILQRLQRTAHELEQAPWTFYMYSDQDDVRFTQSDKPHQVAWVKWRRYADEIEYDLQTLALLANSNRRTTDPARADIFVVPTPLGQFMCSRTLSESEALEALIEHPIFRNVSGNRHLLISTAFVTFRAETASFVRSISNYYSALYNVTVASSSHAALSTFACQNASFRSSFLSRYEFYGPSLQGEHCEDPKFFGRSPVSRYASIGLADVGTDLPLITPTWTKFLHAQYFVFYRTRVEPSFNNSTQYRLFFQDQHLILDPHTQHDFHVPRPSIVGYPASNRSQWLYEFSHSQFCLVLRGDSPNSHALLRSLRVGCIPVIISDTYPIYNPPMPSSLEFDDFALFIPEQAFLRNPQHELWKLTKLDRDTIRIKIAGAKLAQRLLFPDHPQTLLVPALIKEVLVTYQEGQPVGGGYLPKALDRAQQLLARNNLL